MYTKNQIVDMIKIEKNPVVNLVQLYKVVDYDTSIQGFWKDKEDKLYIDSIDLVPYFSIHLLGFYQACKMLFQAGEKCIANKNRFNELVITTDNGLRSEYKFQTIIRKANKPSEGFIKMILDFVEGLTVYTCEDGYVIEIYTKERNHIDFNLIRY